MPYPINQRAHQFNSIQSVPVSFGLWDTALKFLSPGPRSDVTDHLERTITTSNFLVEIVDVAWVEAICGLRLLLGLNAASRGFSPNTPVFSLSSKTNMFKLDMSPVKWEHLTGQEKNDREKRDLCRSPMRFLSRIRWCFRNIL